MNARPMFDKRMLTRLSAFYPSTVDVYEIVDNEPDRMGSPTSQWEPVELLMGLPAQIAPFNDIIPISGERKLQNLSYNTATHRVALAGYYPAITTKMTIKFEDKLHNILGIEFDSHQLTTRIICNEVTI